MLCVTVARTRHKHMIAEHQQVAELGAKLVELRLDYIGRSIDLARLIKTRPTPVVVTCRRREDGGRWERSEDERLMLLRSAIAMGAEYVDLEEDTAQKIPRYGKTKRIVSIHNFEGTPDDLESIHASLAMHDADIVKIAAQANSFSDVVRMFDLMRNAQVPTIGISMGDYGTPSRILAIRYGAPFTYCVFNPDKRVAPGQLSYAQMRDIYRMESIKPSTKLFGVVADPVAHSYSPLIRSFRPGLLPVVVSKRRDRRTQCHNSTQASSSSETHPSRIRRSGHRRLQHHHLERRGVDRIQHRL
jgi:3-dehydroquinate dehydratase / shikimate dehydrogenase